MEHWLSLLWALCSRFFPEAAMPGAAGINWVVINIRASS